VPDIVIQNLTDADVHLGDFYTKVPAPKDNGPCYPNELGVVESFKSSVDLMRARSLHKAIAEGKVALGITFTQDELDSDFCIFPGIKAGGTNLEVLDEGISLTTTADSINFIGAAVTATAVGNDVTVSITGTGGSTTRVYNEVPTGTIDGLNTDYVTSVVLSAGTEAVFRNGVRQIEGATCDYELVESVPASGNFDTVRMAIPLILGVVNTEQITIDFDPA
jgi:hypothetical protein